MSDMQKKQNFLQGTALLAMATAIVKVIGALYKIPLNAIIGEQGFGYFNTAYDIYNVLLMISTAGLPVAMSRMISQASSLDHYNQVRRIYHTARGIFLALGIAGSLLMTVFCRQLAAFQNQPDAWAAIGCLGPCVLLICVMSTYRGFFQGQGNMLPTSVSQVLEAVVKLIVGMGAALAILRMTNEIPLAAGGAILGVTASCLVSAIYLFSRFRKSYALLPQTEEEPRSYRETARGLLAIAIPITFGSAALQLMTMLETKIYMGQLLNLGYTQSPDDTMRGVPLLAEPVTALLGGYSGGNLAMATRLMTVLGFTIIFNALVLVSTAIMQAHGHAGRPVINMLIGGVVNLVAVYVLAGIPLINILGTPIGLLMGYVVISILNILSMRRLLPKPPAILPNLLRSFFAAAVMGVLAWGALWALKAIGVREIGTGRLILCAVPVLVGVVSYFFTAVKFKVITHEDCLLLPKGEKIAKILKL